MDKEEDSYKFPSRFYLLVKMKDGSQHIMGTASLQGFTEDSAEKHLRMAYLIPTVESAEVVEVKSLFEHP